MSRLRRVIQWLPRDMSLPEEEFRSRHNAMTGLLLLHIPVLFAYGFFTRELDPVPLVVELAFPAVAATLGALPMVRRSIRTFAITTGLIYSSVALLHLSGGAAESALHFLIVLAFVFLYRDWFLFLWATLLMGFSYKLLELTSGALGDAMVQTSTPEMALWALMTAASVASIGLILAWKSAEDSQKATIAALETARERDEAAARRDAYSRMYVNLARRGQSLVDRQLSVIDDLEQDVDDPDVLAGLFELDHLTTRIRRHGESLLVVADVDLPTHRDAPVPLADVVRGAQSEIEQYRRVDARVDASIAIDGKVTRDLVHIVAELLDNATSYSAPDTTVTVHARSGESGSVVLTIEDRGIGMDPTRLEQANIDLIDTDELDAESIRHLGFRVIARLSAKHDVRVRLTSTNGGGVTAWVQLPEAMIVAADPSNLAPARMPEEPVVVRLAVEDDPVDDLAVVDVPDIERVGAEESVDEDGVQDEPSAPEPVVGGSMASEPLLPPPAADAAVADEDVTDEPVADEPVADEPPLDEDVAAAPPPGPPLAPFPAPEDAPEPAVTPPSPVAEDDVDEPAEPVLPPPPPSPTVVPVGFSANGSRNGSRNGLLSRLKPSSTPTPPPPVQAPAAAAEEADDEPPAPPAAADEPPPPLPQRQRGATRRKAAEEEALDLFGELDTDGDRASLGDFQRGQEAARQEAHG